MKKTFLPALLLITACMAWYFTAAGNVRKIVDMRIAGTNFLNAKDYYNAFPQLEKASLAGDAEAQNNLGVMYKLGLGVSKDEKQAFEWYEKAALQGHATAQYNLAFMYANGQGVEKDQVKAYAYADIAVSAGFEKSIELRNTLQKLMTPEQIQRAKQISGELLKKNIRNGKL